MGIFSIAIRVLRSVTPSPPPPPTARAPAAPGPSGFPDRAERARSAAEVSRTAAQNGGATLHGPCHVIDGDTIVIGAVHIRLAGIDAPELDEPWGQKSKWALAALCRGHAVTARVSSEMSHDRVVATCHLPDGRDLAAEMVRQGLALDWPAYSGGRYREMEPPGVRKRLWRTHRRQAGGRA